MFRRVHLNQDYEIRREEGRVLFFSGRTRYLIYISESALQLLEMASQMSYVELAEHFQPTEAEEKKMQTFFERMQKLGVVVFDEEEDFTG